MVNFEYFYAYQKEKSLSVYKGFLNDDKDIKLFFLEYDKDLIKEIFEDLLKYDKGELNLDEFKSKYAYLEYGGIEYFIQSYYNFVEEVEENQKQV